MKRRIGFVRLRTASILTAAGLLLGAALTIPTVGAAAADASTKYLGVFRQTSPTEIPSGTVSRYGVTPASVQWFDSWATGNAFNAAAGQDPVEPGHHDALHLGTLEHGSQRERPQPDPPPGHHQREMGQLHQGPRRGVRCRRRTDHGALGTRVQRQLVPVGHRQQQQQPRTVCQRLPARTRSRRRRRCHQRPVGVVLQQRLHPRRLLQRPGAVLPR